MPGLLYELGLGEGALGVPVPELGVGDQEAGTRVMIVIVGGRGGYSPAARFGGSGIRFRCFGGRRRRSRG